MPNKIAHLQMIQGVITRMAGNSFVLRGWTVTLVAAVFALAAKDADIRYILIAYVPTIMFWVLDGYYLMQERRFRDLYVEVAAKVEKDIDFSLNTTKSDRTWAGGIFSVTNFIFYGFMIGIILAIMFIFPLFQPNRG